MKVIKLVKSPSTGIDIQVISSIFCKDDIVYFLPSNFICLEDALASSKREIEVLEKRYKYLEKSRLWILKNLKRNSL